MHRTRSATKHGRGKRKRRDAPHDDIERRCVAAMRRACARDRPTRWSAATPRHHGSDLAPPASRSVVGPAQELHRRRRSRRRLVDMIRPAHPDVPSAGQNCAVRYCANSRRIARSPLCLCPCEPRTACPSKRSRRCRSGKPQAIAWFADRSMGSITLPGFAVSLFASASTPLPTSPAERPDGE